MTTVSELHSMAEDAVLQKAKVEALSRALEIEKARLNAMLQVSLPAAFAGLSGDDGTLLDQITILGRKLELKSFVSGSLLKEPDDRYKAIAWLQRNNGSAMIKHQFEFETRSDQLAADAADWLSDKDLPFKRDYGVHPMTLQAWARDRLKNGQPVEFETLGLTSGQYVKITEPKIVEAPE